MVLIRECFDGVLLDAGQLHTGLRLAENQTAEFQSTASYSAGSGGGCAGGGTPEARACTGVSSKANRIYVRSGWDENTSGQAFLVCRMKAPRVRSGGGPRHRIV